MWIRQRSPVHFNLRQLLVVVGFIALVLGFTQYFTRYDRRVWNYNQVSYLTFSPDGKKLAIVFFRAREEGNPLESYFADVSRTVALLDTANLSNRVVVQHEFRPGYQEPIALRGRSASIAFTAGGRLLWVLDWGCGKIRAWDVSSSSWTANREVKESDINAFVLSPDGTMLATWRRGGLAIWDISSQKRLSLPPISAGSYSFSPDIKYWAFAKRQSVQVWNVRDQTLVRTLHEDCNVHDRVTYLKFSPDGDTLAVRSQTGLRLYSLDTGKEQVILPEVFEVLDDRGWRTKTVIGDSTHGVAFSPDGKFLAAWGEYGLKFFDISQGCKLLRSVADQSINHLAFSPDGKTYATGDRNGKVALWDVATGTELQSTTVSRSD